MHTVQLYFEKTSYPQQHQHRPRRSADFKRHHLLAYKKITEKIARKFTKNVCTRISRLETSDSCLPFSIMPQVLKLIQLTDEKSMDVMYSCTMVPYYTLLSIYEGTLPSVMISCTRSQPFAQHIHTHLLRIIATHICPHSIEQQLLWLFL